MDTTPPSLAPEPPGQTGFEGSGSQARQTWSFGAAGMGETRASWTPADSSLCREVARKRHHQTRTRGASLDIPTPYLVTPRFSFFVCKHEIGPQLNTPTKATKGPCDLTPSPYSPLAFLLAHCASATGASGPWHWLWPQSGTDTFNKPLSVWFQATRHSAPVPSPHLMSSALLLKNSDFTMSGCLGSFSLPPKFAVARSYPVSDGTRSGPVSGSIHPCLRAGQGPSSIEADSSPLSGNASYQLFQSIPVIFVEGDPAGMLAPPWRPGCFPCPWPWPWLTRPPGFRVFLSQDAVWADEAPDVIFSARCSYGCDRGTRPPTPTPCSQSPLVFPAAAPSPPEGHRPLCATDAPRPAHFLPLMRPRRLERCLACGRCPAPACQGRVE